MAESDESGAPKVLGAAVAGLMHDLLGALAVGEAHLVLAAGDLDASHQAARDLEIGLGAIRQATRMAQDALAAERGAAERRDPVDLAAEVERETVRLAQATATLVVRFRSTVGTGSAMVEGPASFVLRVTGNLLRNAVRHAWARVQVGLTAESRGGRDGFLVTVDDDGPGVWGDDRELIFRLPTSTASGYGLGLASARAAATHLGGAVGLDPEPAPSLGGARFWVWLPARLSAQPKGGTGAHPISAGALPAALAGATVVLVDDEPTVRRAIARMLSRAGATVRCPDPAEMGGALSWRALQTEAPDLILLDLDLGGQSGLALFAELSAHAPGLAHHVAFLSGAAHGAVGEEALQRTGRPVLSKPIDLREVRTVVDSIAWLGSGPGVSP